MRFVSLKNTSLTYFNYSGKLSELSGSSKYNLYDQNIELKEIRKNNKIENYTAITDYLRSIVLTEKNYKIIERIKSQHKNLLDICIFQNFNQTPDLNKLDIFEEVLKKIRYTGESEFIKFELEKNELKDKQSIYFKKPAEKNEEKKINKSKVKGKMYALFNLKCSKKFVAFYSVSFPLDTTDDQAFVCWNYWLTHLRKYYNLSNYIWVTERQKNDTIHYHMLTNQFLPILQINRMMAIIINNQVKKGLQSWNGANIDTYNGVDVDSIYNSKRHKKTGKNFNPVELRNWIAKYVTKYVTKNSEKFTHLCWHCSRSVSQLFTSTIEQIENAFRITSHLPSIRNLYTYIKADFNEVWVFHFVPPENIFEKIKYWNNLIFEEFKPKFIRYNNNINFKTTSL